MNASEAHQDSAWECKLKNSWELWTIIRWTIFHWKAISLLEFNRTKDLRQEVNSSLRDTQSSLQKSSYADLKEYVTSAKLAGIDVSDVEVQMPELLKKCLRQEVDSSLRDTQSSLRESHYNALRDHVAFAIYKGVDVSDVEVQMPELLKKCLRQEVDSSLRDTQSSLRESHYNFLKNYVTSAKQAGVDVSDVEIQMPELLNRCIIKR